MDETDDRGYPYPQCDPPFVKDTADLPEQLKQLALAFDADVTALAVATGDALNPPGGVIGSTVAQAPAADAAFSYTSLVFQNSPGMADYPSGRLTAPSAGLYVVVGSCAAAASNNGSAHSLTLLVNGAVVRSAIIRNGAAAGEQLYNSVIHYVVLAAGDVVTMIQSNSVAITYQFVRFGMVRMAKL